jgi:ABC-2 type transport system permease protein
MQELETVLYNSIAYKIGLVVPPEFDQNLENAGRAEIDAYVSWSNRGRVREWKQEYEGMFSTLLGVPVTVNVQDDYVYPQPELGLGLGITALTAITVTLLVGINLMPTLLVEEKQTRTLEALLVSPASISQVVIGKEVAGLFYMLVATSVVFAINLRGVVHWDAAALFALSIGIFAVAVGLVLGSIYKNQQDMTGWSMGITLILLGAMFVDLLNVQVPTFVDAIVPWVPSVALLDVFRSVFLELPGGESIWADLGAVLMISMILYGVVVWLVRRMDR